MPIDGLLYWLLAAAPVFALLGGILFLKWEASRVGAISWFIGIFVAYAFFGANARLLALANAKGVALSLYVLLIIWSAIFLYNVAEGAGAVKTISHTMQKVSDDRLIQCLLLAWCFSSLLQGIAGFGVPVAVVAPIMVGMGFDPIVSVAACLVGHSWSISFGSMGSSYNAIQLVTDLPGEVIGPTMAVVFSVAVFSTGFSVLHIHDGMRGVRKGVFPVFVVGSAMSFVLWLMNVVGIAQIATLAAGMSGCALLTLACLRPQKKTPPPAIPEDGMGIHAAASPYYAVVLLTLFSQVPTLRTALKPYFWGLDFPSASTTLGHAVEAVSAYSKIQFFSHPAPILLASAIFGAFFYTFLGASAGGTLASLRAAGGKTVRKCVPTSVGIVTMVMMAIVMSDTGMTNCIARGVAAFFGRAYPLVSPFVGTLGTFITGSNTNSNVMFGMMQYETAAVLGQSAVLMAAAQSVGGSLGVAIAPSTILMGATNVGAGGRESEIMGRTIRYGILNTALVGIFVWFLGR